METSNSEVGIIEQLSEKLANLGYDVTRNAKLRGQSGAEHTFKIIASRNNGFINYQVAIGVSVYSKGSVGLNTIFNFDEKAYDAGVSYKAFIAIPKLSTLPTNFANRQRIRVYNEKTLQDFLTRTAPPIPKEQQKIEITNRVEFIESLIAHGYTVTEGATVKGNSGVEYTFDILACMDDGLVNYQIGLDFIRADNEVSLEQVSSYDTKAYDSEIQFKVLVVSPGLSDEAELLAKKQHIQVFEFDEQSTHVLTEESQLETEVVTQPPPELESVAVESETTNVQPEEKLDVEAELEKEIYEETIVEETTAQETKVAEIIVEEAKDEETTTEETIIEQAVSGIEPIAAQPFGQEPTADADQLNALIKASTPEALQLIPEDVARRYNVIPLSVMNNTLRVAMVNPNDILAIEDLEVRTRKRISPVPASEDTIKEAIDHNYEPFEETEGKLGPEALSEKQIDLDRLDIEESDTAQTATAINQLIEEAIKSRATDVYIEPGYDRLRVRFRIDGLLNEVSSLPVSSYGQIISHIKTAAGINVEDSQHHQYGHFTTQSRGKEIEVNVSTIVTTSGEMVRLKLRDKSLAVLSLSELGLQPESRGMVEQMLKAPYGMILASGPTGCGTTTTLKTLINSMDRANRSIVTIEDPVEYYIEGINQIQINHEVGGTIADMLLTVSTQDPDVIMVSELDDSETVKIATHAAATGKLILGVVHANDSVGVLFRLIELGVEPFLLSSTVIGTIDQRMIRRVCQHCARKLTAPAVEQTAYYRETGEKLSEFNYGVGCKACAHTGYLGRTTIFEVLHITDEIRQLLISEAKATEVRAKAIEEGMITLAKDGMLKAKQGITNPHEVLRNIYGAAYHV